MATSLSSITDLSIYGLDSTLLNDIINGQDIKIEISLGSSEDDTSRSYSSYKLDLNQLLNIIKTYVDEKYAELSILSDNKFVHISGETRQISSDNLTFKTSNNLILHSNNVIQLSSNSNIYDTDHIGLQFVTNKSQIMLTTDDSLEEEEFKSGARIILKTGNDGKHVKVLNKENSGSSDAKDVNKIECVATAALWN